MSQDGEILRAIANAGTLVIFTSDHGEGLGSHRWTGKMMFYEEEAAVPLIVSWKGVTPAGRIDRTHLVSALDVLPTICDYAGIQPPASIRGESLRPVIEQPDQSGHEFVVSEMARGGQGGPGRSFLVRTKNYKYMVFPGSQRVELFFDLATDPGELKNLAGEATLAAEVERHRQLLAQWIETTEEDKHPVEEPAQTPRRKPGR